jgi:hypothetical protein
MLLRHRIQEWAAERFAWVQYPDIRNMRETGMRFKTPMPWTTRIGLVLFGVMGLAISTAVLVVLGVLVYCVVSG